MQDVLHTLWENVKATTPLEGIAVVMGVISVYFSRRENIWVYPTGLINTVIYIYISLQGQLIGEASVNVYYTVMSVYGWWLWTQRDAQRHPVVSITYSTGKERIQQAVFFLVFYVALFFLLTYLRRQHFPNAIPWADAFASATAYTGMWLMARKKVESWWWWMATNIASVPLYASRGYVFTGLYYVVLLAMAVWGLAEWRRKVRENRSATKLYPQAA